MTKTHSGASCHRFAVKFRLITLFFCIFPCSALIRSAALLHNKVFARNFFPPRKITVPACRYDDAKRVVGYIRWAEIRQLPEPTLGYYANHYGNREK